MTKIHAFQNARSTNWAGGKTNELIIHPAGAIYAERDFDFRISTATIEVEESDFTSLPDYNRLLAVLEGELELIHDAKYTKSLRVFESDDFHGSWKTSSRGKARDFNVIYSDRYALDFELVSINEATTIYKESDFLFLFALNASPLLNAAAYDLIEITSGHIELEKGFTYFKIVLQSKDN